MATPFYYGNRIIEVAVEKLEIMLRLDLRSGNSKPDQQGRDAEDFRFEPRQNHGQNHEDYAGNPIHLLLIVLCGAALFHAAKQRRLSITEYYALSLLAGYLVLCLYLRWNIFITRYHLPLFVLGAPLIAVTLSGSFLVRARTYIVVLLVVASQFALLYNETRPLIGGKSIFVVPRLEQYFRNSTDLFPQYSHAAFLLKDKLCSQVGFLTQDNDSWEYPLWVLLEVGPVSSLRIENLRVENQSAKASVPGAMSDFIPCGLVAVNMTERPDLIIEGGREYFKAWMGKKVAVYEVK